MATLLPFALALGCVTGQARAGGVLALLPLTVQAGLAQDYALLSVAAPSRPAGPLPDGTVVDAALPSMQIARVAPVDVPAAPAAADPSPTSPPPAAVPAPDSQAVSAAMSAAENAPAPVSSAAAAPVPDGPVESLRDAIVDSLKNNPDIQIALAQQDDARFAIGEARAGYMPHLDVTIGYGREMAKTGTAAATNRWRTEGTASLNQNVWDFGTTINDIKRARASYRSAQWGTRERIEGISYDITNAYLGLLQQQKLVALTEQEIAGNQKILRMVTVQKELGLTSAADVERAKARLENVQSSLLDRKSGLQQARDTYRRLTNHEPGRAIDLPPTITALPANVESAVDMIDTNSPRMAQAVEDRRSLAKQYASQTGTFFPRVGLLLQGNHKYDVQGRTGLAEDARAMVTVSYSFNGGGDYATRQRIGARLREADYELDRRRREVEQDLRTDFQALTAARSKIATINAEIDAAQRVADLYRQQFREGKRSVFDLLDSQQVLFTARSNEVVNRIAMQAAEYRVLQKLGGLFDLVSSGEPLPPLVVPAPQAKAAAKGK